MADQGRLDELKRKFEENPKRYFAPLANEYRKAGEPELAIELCRTYLPQQPTHMSGYIVYGQSLHDAGRADESAAVFKQALTLDPENIIALRQLGDIARDAGDRAGAMRWYGKVLELDPRNEEISAYITSLAQPDARPATAAPERPVPPTIRPEPAHDEAAVRLEDIVSQPDVAQTPFMVDDAFASADTEAFFEARADQPPDQIAADEPFEVTAWPLAAEPGFDDRGGFGDSHSTPVLEGPWHSAAEPDELPVASDETVAADPSEATPADGEGVATSAEPSAAQPRESRSPFVTETMAELYLSQGLRAEALVIYRELAITRDDPALHRRIAELDSAGETSPAGETVRAFFARIGARKPNERVELAADRESALAALLGAASRDPADLGAAERLSGAFGNQRSGASQS
jgi:tetratricopeptide (TPR) repeat protein